jgi:hypothetical protein
MDQEWTLAAVTQQPAHQILLIWEWTQRQPSHPPTALAGLARLAEDRVCNRETLPVEYRASLAETVEGMARVLAETLERQALLRAEPKGPAS